MTEGEIRRILEESLRDQNIEQPEITLSPDPYRGWRVRIVAQGFQDLTQDARREAAFRNVDRSELEWIELLTPDEALWSGEIVEPHFEDLPLWPEALAKPPKSSPIVFPSDLDEDLPTPIVGVFYSLRGGVGRSTALAYTAKILARRGRRVLCMDMDFEAPGLAPLFGREDSLQDGTGAVPLLLELEQDPDVDLLDHVISVSETSQLYCLPAGRPNAEYARQLRLLDPEVWYRERPNPLSRLIELAGSSSLQPDFILLDARTGLNPLSAPLLFDVSDIAVIAFYPHPQARVGTEALVQAMLRRHTHRGGFSSELTPEPRFLVSPMPNGLGPDAQRLHLRALEWIDDWLSDASATRASTGGIEPTEVTQFVDYSDTIAASDYVGDDANLCAPYEGIADWLDRYIPTREETRQVDVVRSGKSDALSEFRFSAGTAESQEDFLDSFVRTDVVSRAIDPDVPVVLGRKGTGKTAIFRRLLEDDESDVVAVTTPDAYRAQFPWVLGPTGFANLDADVRTSATSGWRDVWVIYCALCVALTIGEPDAVAIPDEIKTALEPLWERPSERSIVIAIRAILADRDAGLIAWEWLQALDVAPGSTARFLLLDGLDTCFGNTGEDRVRRGIALAELFSLMLEREPQLVTLSFKVLLREDIWRELRFNNKSHLLGRTVRIEWRNQADYAKTALKQALRSEAFRRSVEANVGTPLSLDDWSEDEVFRAWTLLVGERMKGGKTTFTRNWAWNRLADGNGDHSPRYLFQLLRGATEWEREESRVNPYDRSIIRPRALAEALPEVSTVAVDALYEEFKELEPLVGRLRSIGRSPIEPAELTEEGDAVDLAREVGLLGIYEGTADEVVRYRIPDLYRNALGITRRGPA